MIDVQGLTKQFGELTALKNVSFSVEKGQIVGFLGANGAGKTTTMDILCGCMGADYGTASIGGFDITENPIEAKKRLGYLPDEPPLYREMKVIDLITFAAKINKVPKAKVKQLVQRAIDRLDLDSVKNRLVGNLSKGFRQRVAFAQAIVHDPDVLVLDEPTEGLDPNQIVQIRKLIRDLRVDHTIILSSHILHEVQQTCDYIIIIDKGQIVQKGTYEELISDVQAANTYKLSVRNNPKAILQFLNGRNEVSAVQLLDDETVEFNVKGAEKDVLLDALTQKIVADQHGLRSLSATTKTLEDVFFQITH